MLHTAPHAAPNLYRYVPGLDLDGGEPGFPRRAVGPGWALVGDAGAFRDPITSHGITDALRDAECLAHAILRGTDAALAEYKAARDDLMRDMIRLSDAIASFDWSVDEVRSLHLELSRVMKREVDAIRTRPRVLTPRAIATRAAVSTCDRVRSRRARGLGRSDQNVRSPARPGAGVIRPAEAERSDSRAPVRCS
jgi:hypothetical protein